MRLAYADPPYIGCSAAHYADHPDYAGEVDHEALIRRLGEYDAWALSCHSNSLRVLLPLCPESVRVAAWVKPFAFFKPGVAPKYAWEPVIFYGQRKERERIGGRSNVRDWLSANAWGVTARERTVGVHGKKRREFCFWIFGLLGAQAGDTLDDLFPGTGGGVGGVAGLHLGRDWRARDWPPVRRGGRVSPGRAAYLRLERPISALEVFWRDEIDCALRHGHLAGSDVMRGICGDAAIVCEVTLAYAWARANHRALPGRKR